MKRREALTFIGLGAGAALLPTQVPYVFAAPGLGRRDELNLGLQEFGIYDPDYFQAAERFMPLDQNRGIISLLPREDKFFYARLEFAGDSEFGPRPLSIPASDFPLDGRPVNVPVPFGTGVGLSQEILCRVKYRLLYREAKGPWNATPWRVARTPSVPAGLEDLTFCLVGDPHPFDDRQGDRDPLSDDELKAMRNSGDAVNYFLIKLLRNPNYAPRGGTEEAKLMHNFCLASTVHQLMQERQRGTLYGVIDMGDTWGGAIHAWPGLGLTPFNLCTDDQLYQYTKMFCLAFRKTYSGLNPTTMVARSLGNHDGENGWNRLRPYNLKWRKQYCPAPGEEQGQSPDENFYELRWGMMGRSSSYEHLLSLLILDSTAYNRTWPNTLQGWRIGRNQRAWFQQSLSESKARYKIACFHHVIGGWPTESDPNRFLSPDYRPPYFYGRGGMFRADQYHLLSTKVPDDLLGKMDKVRQPGLTREFLKKGGSVWFYAHDHVFRPTPLGTNSGGEPAYGISVGSTNYELYEFWIRNGLFWQDPVVGYGQSGGYGRSATGRGDFLGPSGYTKLIVPKDGDGPLTVQYIRSAWHLNTNLSPASRVGDILYQIDI